MASQSGLISHLIELRSRLLSMLVSVLLIFVCLSPFAQDIYHLLARPLLNALPDGASMIATDVASPFLAPFKLTLVVAFFISIPYILYHI
ncbi:MAG: twin-arginine translocase subunit TatC, partial [Glaciecola sp.]|nr:twin-arginine translocase subunit TatC [Glaciecola sp.]